jgi:hypothetical protein
LVFGLSSLGEPENSPASPENKAAKNPFSSAGARAGGALLTAGFCTAGCSVFGVTFCAAAAGSEVASTS